MEIKVTKSNFENDVLNSEKPVLVDFWATWCGPCRMLAPELQKLDKDYGEKLTIGKINVDEEDALASAFRVSSIPTLVLIKDKKASTVSVGYRTKEDLESILKSQGII